MSGVNLPALEQFIAQAVNRSLASSGIAEKLASLQPNADQEIENTSDGSPTVTADEPPPLSRADRFFSDHGQQATISEDLLEFTKKAFSTALSKEKWKEVSSSYPPVAGTENFLSAPRMEAGMKEDLKKRHGFKTKDILSLDEGLVDRHNEILMVTRPLLSALSALDLLGEEGSEPDPDSVKDMIEEALVLLGNAHIRLNSWRQRRFSEFLTDVGKRALREGLPSDHHLFPNAFHDIIKKEHEHALSTSKAISAPKETQRSWAFQRNPYTKNFSPSNNGQKNSRGAPKRQWPFRDGPVGTNKRFRGGVRQTPASQPGRKA